MAGTEGGLMLAVTFTDKQTVEVKFSGAEKQYVPFSHALADVQSHLAENPRLCQATTSLHVSIPSYVDAEPWMSGLVNSILGMLPMLTSIYLSNVSISGASGHALVRSLATRVHLRNVGVNGSALAPGDIRLLGASLLQLPQLHTVSAYDTQLNTVDAMKAWAEVLPRIRRLKVVNMESNEWNEDIAAVAIKMLSKMINLRKFSVSSSMFSGDSEPLRDAVEQACRAKVDRVDQTLTRLSALFQVFDLITDVLFITFVAVSTDLAATSISGLALNAVAAYLLFVAILIGIVPFLRGKFMLRAVWMGEKSSIGMYKLCALFEGGIEILVVYAVRSGKPFGLFDYVFIGASIALLVFDLKFLLGALAEDKHVQTSITVMLTLMASVLLTATLSRYVGFGWAGWPIILLVTAYALAGFWSVTLSSTFLFFSMPRLRYVYIALLSPLLVPMLWTCLEREDDSKPHDIFPCA